MKRFNFLSMILLLIAAMLAGCNNESDESSAISVQDNGSLTQNVFADETNGKSGVTFTTTGSWTSSISETKTSLKSDQLGTGAPAWISISPDHGDKAGNYTISISLEPNTTGADRAAIITISCNGTDITISVTQKATKEDGTKPVAKRIVEFEVYSCNAQWSPENNISYIAATGAHISVYKSSDDDPVEDYSTDENGRVAFELEPGDYVYRVLWSNDGKREQNVSRQGFVIAGIFTSQEEIDNFPMQSDAKLGNLKFVDMNQDGIINDDDKVFDELVFLHVDANENESKMQVKTYIAPYDFMPDYGTVPYEYLIGQMKKLFGEMLSQAWQIDAAMTHEATLPYLDNYANFTIGPYDSWINAFWNAAYRTINNINYIMQRTDVLTGITEAERQEYRGEAQYYRAYSYSVLLNYFGGVPLITAAVELPQSYELSRNSEEEVRDFIMRECDEAYTRLPSSGNRYAAQQIKARVLLNISDFAGAANALRAIIDAGMYRLPPNLEWGGDAISGSISYSTADFPSVMRKGNGTVYPVRYAETLLLYAEASLSLGNLAEASNIVNQFAMQQGQAPTLAQDASVDEILSATGYLWSSQLNKEGSAFARLKRANTFIPVLSPYGATEKNKLLPIPAPELNLNPNMTQNPGW